MLYNSLRAKTILGGAFALLVSAQIAYSHNFKIEYSLSFAGIPVGKTKIFGSVNGASYTLDGQVKVTGLAGVFVSGKGTGRSTGTIGASNLTSTHFSANGTVGKTAHIISIVFNSGSAQTTAYNPPMEASPDRIAVTAAHLKGTIDPLSALFTPIPAGKSPFDVSNCPKMLPVFDGGSRHTLNLHSGSVQDVKISGYKGKVLVCKIKYTPVAGHRPGKKNVRFMENNKKIWVWYAPVSGTNLLAPVRISVPTRNGVAEASVSVFK